MGLGFFKALFGGGEEKKPAQPASKTVPAKPLRRGKLRPSACRSTYKHPPRAHNSIVHEKPYALARSIGKKFHDGRAGEKPERFQKFGVPKLQTPQDISNWLKIPLKTLAWMSNYHKTNEVILKKQHYRYQWLKKNKGGYRLIEIPKPMLAHIQRKILHEILDKVPPHPAAHGFTKGRSIVTNARIHSNKYVILKFDLRNFYPSVGSRHVKSIFRGLGYNIEICNFLSRLCTNCMPGNVPKPGDAVTQKSFYYIQIPYLNRHLPQGAPTSPALANLAAWPLDVRLSGLAKKFGVTYTRYADDITFSGDEKFMRGKIVNILIRYIKAIIRDEKFERNDKKMKIARRGNRQIVTGLMVNTKPNVKREDFDRLKAILHNCVKKGAPSQNREKVENFKAHLEGRISFVKSINPEKAVRLEKLFDAITVWS